MAINWGAEAGSTRESVGIEVSYAPPGPSSTSILVTVDFYVYSVYNISDDQVLTLTGSLGGSVGFHCTGGSAILVNRQQFNAPVSYSGGPSYTFIGTISGHFGGATPTASVGWTVPARPASQPSKIVAPMVSNIDSSGADIWWPAPEANGSGIDYYQVNINTDINNPDLGVQQRTQTGSAGRFSGLARATQYYARVVAHNALGFGTWSDPTSLLTLAVPPGQPTITSITNIQADSMQVSWSAPDNGGTPLIDYAIHMSKNASFSPVTNSTVVAAGTTTAVMSGLDPGTTYYVRVIARNAIGYGYWGPYWWAMTLSGIKVRVNGVWVDAVLYSRVNGAWVLVKLYKRVNGAWVT